MELASVQPELLLDCISATASQTDSTEQQIVDALASKYPDARAVYARALGSLSRLPPELAAVTLSEMTPRGIAALGRTSTSLYRLTREPKLWRDLIQRDWGYEYNAQYEPTPFEEYGLMYRAYIAHYRVAEIFNSLKNVAATRLFPDTDAADYLKTLILSTTVCIVEYEGRGAKVVDLAESAVEPGEIVGIVLSVPYQYGVDQHYRKWWSPWCSRVDERLWTHSENNIQLQIAVAEVCPTTEAYGSKLVHTTFKGDGTLVLELWKTTPTYRKLEGPFMGPKNVIAYAASIKSALLSVASPRTAQGRKFRLLVSNQHKFWLYTRDVHPETRESRGAVYDDRDTALHLYRDDKVKAVRYTIIYSFATSRNGPTPPECLDKDSARLFDTVASPFGGTDISELPTKIRDILAPSVPAIDVDILLGEFDAAITITAGSTIG